MDAKANRSAPSPLTEPPISSLKSASAWSSSPIPLASNAAL